MRASDICDVILRPLAAHKEKCSDVFLCMLQIICLLLLSAAVEKLHVDCVRIGFDPSYLFPGAAFGGDPR